jgi:hypothetical protein
LLGALRAHDHLFAFASRGLGHIHGRTTTGLRDLGRGASLITSAFFAIACLNSNSEAHHYKGKDEFFHDLSYTRFLGNVNGKNHPAISLKR